MPTKTITVTEEAYDVMARDKKEGESFSQLFLRITNEKGSLSECLGLWNDVLDEDLMVYENIAGSWDISDRDLSRRLKGK